MIKDIKLNLMEQFEQVELWIAKEYGLSQPVIYSSVDIRNASFKSAHVDNNLFPAGFNNFDSQQLELAAVSFKEFMQKNYPNIRNIVILPEFHTRNSFYIDNLLAIKKIIEYALFEVRFVFTNMEDDILTLNGNNGNNLIVYNYNVIDGYLHLTDGFVSDIMIVNNDMSGGIPDIISELKIPVIPNIMHSWQQRSKYNHFAKYQMVIRKFCKDFGFDEFFLSTEFEKFQNIDFRNLDSLKLLANHVDKMLAKIAKKYQDNNITETPYIFIKADNGTYGMGIMTVYSGEDILKINKQTRSKLTSLKNGLANSTILLQEGVPTINNIGGNSAEPMVYLVDCKILGQVLRVNRDKDNHGNLNSKGMFFTKYDSNDKESLYLNSVLARLSTIAAGRENDAVT